MSQIYDKNSLHKLSDTAENFKMAKNASEPKFTPLDFQKIETSEQIKRAGEFYENLNRRRTVRDFSDADVPFELIEKAILTAGTAPSGANMQPWRFVVVKDKHIKRAIRVAAEREEYSTQFSPSK